MSMGFDRHHGQPFFMLLPELVEPNTSASMFLLLGAFAITAVTLA